MSDRVTPPWFGTLKPTDWLIDGSPVRSRPEIWNTLDWSRAWLDLGPSPAGNPGPYWHVPWDADGEEVWARLYPKITQTKWQPLIRHAIEAHARAVRQSGTKP